MHQRIFASIVNTHQPHQISLQSDISKRWSHNASLPGSQPDVKHGKANRFWYLNTFTFSASAQDERMHLSTLYWSEDRNEAWRWANVKTNYFTSESFLTLNSKYGHNLISHYWRPFDILIQRNPDPPPYDQITCCAY